MFTALFPTRLRQGVQRSQLLDCLAPTYQGRRPTSYTVMKRNSETVESNWEAYVRDTSLLCSSKENYVFHTLDYPLSASQTSHLSAS